MKRPPLSASNLYAAALCPGKPALESQFGEGNTEASARGTNLHPYFRTDLDRSHLPVRDRELLEQADRLAQRFMDDFIAGLNISAAEEFTDEHEIALEGIVPGHPDNVLTWRNGSHVVILDLKTGMGDVDEAPSNYQLADYAALVWQRKPFEVCGVAIIQPDALGGEKKMTTALYRAGQMPAVIGEIESIKAATEQPNARRAPGDKQCQWCRAKTACPEYTRQLLPITSGGPLAASMLGNEELVSFHLAGKAWAKIEKDVKAEMLRRIVAGELKDFTTKPGNTRREVVDTKGAYQIILSELPSHEETLADAFLEACTLSMAELKAPLAKLLKCPQTKMERDLKTWLAPVIEEKQNAPSIVPAKDEPALTA